jgi:O-antigen/teichoic acid export membrane protein
VPCTLELAGVIIKKQLQRDSIVYLISKIIPGGMGLLSVMTFVRLVGYEEYGRYAVALSLATTVSAWAAGWLNPGILRFKSDWGGVDGTSRFRGAIAVGLAISAAGGGITVFVGLGFLFDRSSSLSILTAGVAAAAVSYAIVLTMLQAGLLSIAVAKLEAARTVLAFLVPVAIIVATHNRSYTWLLVGALSGYLVPLALVAAATRVRVGQAQASIRTMVVSARPILRQIWLFGWPVALWALGSQGLSVWDRYLIQQFRGYTDAGIYASMYDVVVRSLSLLFFPITLATHPIVMKLWNTGARRAALDVIKTSIAYQIALCIPILLGFLVLAPLVTRVVLGPNHNQAVRLVIPLALGGCLWQLALLVHKPLEIMCATKRMLVAISFAFGFGLAANYLLIPRYGMLAASYVNVAAAVTYLTSLFLLTPIDDLRRQAAQPHSIADDRLAASI